MKAKDRIIVDIQNPCDEDWHAMKPVAEGRFCASCAKNVVDFTGMTKAEVANFLLQHNGPLCGRLNVDFLNVELKAEKEKSGGQFYSWLMRAAVFTGITLPIAANAMGAKPSTELSVIKNKVADEPGKLTVKVSGTVRDKDTGELIVNAVVLINNKKDVFTDENGVYTATVEITDSLSQELRITASAGFYYVDEQYCRVSPVNAAPVIDFTLSKKQMPHNTIYGIVAGREYGKDVNDVKYDMKKNNHIEVVGYPDLFSEINSRGEYSITLPDTLVGCQLLLKRMYNGKYLAKERNVVVLDTAVRVDFIDYYARRDYLNKDAIGYDSFRGGVIIYNTVKKKSFIKRLFTRRRER